MRVENCAQDGPGRGSAGRPTGFRKLTPGLLKVDRAAEAFDGLPTGLSRPGQLLAAFKAAAPRLGVSHRLVHAVDWFFRFTQPQDWEEGTKPLVWPSAELQREAFSLSATQVKAINRALIEAGLLTICDSPNGKRYGRRDRQGRITEAYGFDLSPLAARHAEFLRLAAEAQAERQLLGRLRRRITIARKGIAQLVEAAIEYGLPAAEWAELAAETQRRVRQLRDVASPADLECGVIGLERRQNGACEHLERLFGVVETDPKGPENRPHTTVTTESLNLADTVTASQESSGDRPVVATAQPMPTGEGGLRLSAPELVRLAPRLKPYLRGGPDPTWPELVDAADWLRDELEISKAAWGEACQLLGREGAAVAVAIVSTKAESHFQTSPGGYFRGMLAKARAHELNLDRTLWKLRTAARSRPPTTRQEESRWTAGPD